MTSVLRSLRNHLFPQLVQALRDIRQEAFNINRYHYFRYKIYSVTPSDVTADSGSPEHLFPETKQYLDSVTTPELEERVRQMEIVMEFLTKASLRLHNPKDVLCLVPQSLCVSGLVPIARDLQELNQIKETPEYQEFLTHCLFIQMGAL